MYKIIMAEIQNPGAKFEPEMIAFLTELSSNLNCFRPQMIRI